MKKTAFFLIFFLIFNLFAKDRPTVGLVLSGGGARGGAHVGILKFLEENHIPVDYIVGTSMGSFVGGLYASGYSADEIKTFLTTTKWDDYITSDIPREKIPFRRKLLMTYFPGSIRFGINHDNEIVLPNGIFKRQFMISLLEKKFSRVLHIKDFNKFPIPFIAVATDLSTGNYVALNKGNIAKSIYASISVPGGFEPITINNRVLVDGGISQNLPVKIMREKFHPDYIIAVDISTPFDKTRKFNSYEEIMSQQLDILTRKNVEDTIKSLKSNEILIEPKLKGYSFLDADKYPQIIQIGYNAAKEAKNKISFLAVSKKEFKHYRQKHRYKPDANIPVIDEIKIENNTFVSDKIIRSFITQPIGKQLDFKKLQKDLNEIYYLMYFSDVDFDIIRQNGKNILVIKTKPSWHAHGNIRGGIALEGDLNGHNDYQIRLEYNKYNLNSFGGELRTRVEFGRVKMFKEEFYQPLDIHRNYFFRANAYIDRIKYYVSPGFIDGVQKTENDNTLPITSDDIGFQATVGINIKKIIRLESGINLKQVKPSVDFLLTNGSNAIYATYTQKQKLSDIYAKAAIDSMDNPFFPRNGYKGFVKYYKVVDILKSDLKYSQVFGKISGAYTFGNSTIIPTVKIGTTYNDKDLAKSGDISAFYNLGGLFNISGRTTYNQTGDHIYFASLNYRYLVLSNKFLKSITSEAYVGASLEMGKAWYKKIDNASLKNALFGSSIYLGIDTMLGPFYIAYGFSDKNHQTLYFSLGKSY